MVSKYLFSRFILACHIFFLALIVTACSSDSSTKKDEQTAIQPSEIPAGAKTGNDEGTDLTKATGEIDGSTAKTPTEEKPKNETAEAAPKIFAVEEAHYSENRIFAVKVLWLQGPRMDANDFNNDVELTFADENLGETLSVEINHFETWMPSMGHGGYDRYHEVVPDTEKPGVFRIVKFSPSMGGDWQLRIKATVNGKQDRILVSFDI